jgi:prepilin-type N-terminal cleavage/methylation domain-containing protein
MSKLSRTYRGFTLVELMIVVAIIGVLSTVAIPSFMKYIRRSKTTEAVMNIRKLFDGAVTYYEAEHASSSGAILARQFPDAVKEPSPAMGTCCKQTGQKCAPSASYWTDQTWQALNFSVDDPHYYSYSFPSSGTEKSAKFDATANGDLDCDDAYSTFSRHGSVDKQGGVVGGSGLYTKNDIE